MAYDYTALQADILTAGKRADYAGAKVQRFITEAEDRIRARLEAWELIYPLDDSSRPTTTQGNYNLLDLGINTVNIRYVLPSDPVTNVALGPPLEKVDFTMVVQARARTDVTMYCPFTQSQIWIAGNPAPGSKFYITSLGLPARLSVLSTNALLQDQPLLYLAMSLASLYRETREWDAMDRALSEGNGLIDALNRRNQKKTSGARSSNAYNTTFRSSY